MNPEEYLSQLAKVFFWCASIYLIPILSFIFKKIAKDASGTEAEILLDPQPRTAETFFNHEGQDYAPNDFGMKKQRQPKPNMTRRESIPKQNLKDKIEYDVALSFAGEDRKYAEQLARLLIRQEITVFYDEYERSALWGQDLYQYLSEVYQKKAKYCVIFVSEHYVRKRWTNVECRAALARAFKENSPYILPIKLDDAEIPGILPTVGYMSWHKDGAELILKCLMDKLKNAR